MLRGLALLVRIDARRPAAWLALATAVAAAWLLPLATVPGSPPAPVTSILLGGVLAVMAVGGLEAAATERAGPWFAERAAWPLAGWVAAAGLRGEAVSLVAGGLAVVAVAAARRSLAALGLVAADAASAALAAAAAAGAVGWAVTASGAGGGAGVAAAVVVLAIFAAGVMACATRGPAEWEVAPRHSARRLLTALAMGGALTGMVAWLLLAEDRTGLDLAASLALLVALAVPAATLGDGVSHLAAWRRVERAAPVADPRRRLPPGRRRDILLGVLVPAAILGWPPIVAATLSGADAGLAGPSALIVATIAAVAVVLWALARLGEAVGASPDTVHAAILAAACAAVLAAVFVAPRPAAVPSIPAVFAPQSAPD